MIICAVKLQNQQQHFSETIFIWKLKFLILWDIWFKAIDCLLKWSHLLTHIWLFTVNHCCRSFYTHSALKGKNRHLCRYKITGFTAVLYEYIQWDMPEVQKGNALCLGWIKNRCDFNEFGLKLESKEFLINVTV